METESKMLVVERACIDSVGKAAYLWKVLVRKAHVSMRQKSGKECACMASACKFRSAINFD